MKLKMYALATEEMRRYKARAQKLWTIGLISVIASVALMLTGKTYVGTLALVIGITLWVWSKWIEHRLEMIKENFKRSELKPVVVPPMQKPWVKDYYPEALDKAKRFEQLQRNQSIQFSRAHVQGDQQSTRKSTFKEVRNRGGSDGYDSGTTIGLVLDGGYAGHSDDSSRDTWQGSGGSGDASGGGSGGSWSQSDSYSDNSSSSSSDSGSSDSSSD